MHLLQSLELTSNRILASCTAPADHVSDKGCVQILLAGGPVEDSTENCPMQAASEGQGTVGQVPEGPIRSVHSAVTDCILGHAYRY
jgi:hypothetical protein